MAGKVNLATLYEQVSKKTGTVYLKGAFGPFDLLLFRDDANVMIGKDGRRIYAWHLVMSENQYAKTTGRPFLNLGAAVPEASLPDDEQQLEGNP